ncbi:MAG: general secretion pathway protein GspF [Gammaproteobacteria bacterium]|nr:general secretion pathway protein GspF [Gammaproteobacteria bacterium]MDH5801717.1 general secretion pathway protein GspF [Gammaproteobacteria bacterium]
MYVPKSARSIQEYIELVNAALDEIFDLRASIEYDEEYMGDASIFLSELERGVKSLLQSLQSGDYEFGGEPLSFAHIVKKTDERLLPFKHLLNLIIKTHEQGLDDGAD